MFRASLSAAVVLLIFSPTPAWADTYDMVKEYAGQTFFDDWVFYNNYDNLTNGDAIFVSQAEAFSQNLAYVDSTTNHAIIKVDNTTDVPYNIKRNTVRISTSDLYGVGSVWTADIYYAPYGCSVWPAWWSQAPAWPVGGEIDTYEGVNLMVHNQISLHTLSGCTQTGQNQSSTLVNSTDCSSTDNNNQGCVTTDPSAASFGEPFSASQGGVFVTEFAETGISIWFFPRSSIPTPLSSNSSTLDTSTLGLPIANYPATTCNSTEYFSPQELILDITLCGDFAGDAAIFNETCTGVCYNDYVIGNGTNYATAYFEIASIRVFSKEGTNTVVSGGGAGANSSSATASGTASGSQATKSAGISSAAFNTGGLVAATAVMVSLLILGTV